MRPPLLPIADTTDRNRRYENGLGVPKVPPVTALALPRIPGHTHALLPAHTAHFTQFTTAPRVTLRNNATHWRGEVQRHHGRWRTSAMCRAGSLTV